MHGPRPAGGPPTLTAPSASPPQHKHAARPHRLASDTTHTHARLIPHRHGQRSGNPAGRPAPRPRKPRRPRWSPQRSSEALVEVGRAKSHAPCHCLLDARRKYRKMRAKFEETMNTSNSLFKEEYKMMALARRLQEQNESVPVCPSATVR